MKESKRKPAKPRTSRTAKRIGAASPRFIPGTGSSLITESLIIARGRVQWSKESTFSLIATRSANIRVYWAGRVLPPSVFVGNKVNFIGRFVTWNEGKLFRVQDAIVFTGKYQDIVRPVMKFVYESAEDPREWAEKEALDRLLIQDV